jgi:hypothetical protein
MSYGVLKEKSRLVCRDFSFTPAFSLADRVELFCKNSCFVLFELWDFWLDRSVAGFTLDLGARKAGSPSSRIALLLLSLRDI